MKYEKSGVSVVIPTLNRCLPLGRALNSVLKQSVKPDEIIVVDNGSADETVQMIRLNYPSVKLLFEKKTGVSAARNLGIKAATGNWIALLDSDDEWYANKLERQLECHANCSNSTRLIHTNEVWKKNNVLKSQMRKHRKSGGDIFLSCLPLCCISPSSSIVRKDVFEDIGYFDENLPACEDYDFWLRLCAHEEVFFLDEELLIKHGGHSDQLSQKYWAMDRFRVYSLEKLIGNEDLSSKNQEAALEMLLNKLRVLVEGGLKRENTSLVQFYSKKMKFWTKFLNDPKKKVVVDKLQLEENSNYYFEQKCSVVDSAGS